MRDPFNSSRVARYTSGSYDSKRNTTNVAFTEYYIITSSSLVIIYYPCAKYCLASTHALIITFFLTATVVRYILILVLPARSQRKKWGASHEHELPFAPEKLWDIIDVRFNLFLLPRLSVYRRDQKP